MLCFVDVPNDDVLLCFADVLFLAIFCDIFFYFFDALSPVGDVSWTARGHDFFCHVLSIYLKMMLCFADALFLAIFYDILLYFFDALSPVGGVLYAARGSGDILLVYLMMMFCCVLLMGFFVVGIFLIFLMYFILVYVAFCA